MNLLIPRTERTKEEEGESIKIVAHICASTELRALKGMIFSVCTKGLSKLFSTFFKRGKSEAQTNQFPKIICDVQSRCMHGLTEF